MNSYQIFRVLNKDLSKKILNWLKKSDKETYTLVLSSLAISSKLRPIFVQRKSAEDQIAWLLKKMQLKSSDMQADQAIKSWLMKEKKSMIVEFLDTMEIKHDDEGVIEDVPDKLDKEKLNIAIDKILENNTINELTLYLHIFQNQKEDKYEEITELLSDRKDLKLD